MALMVGARNLVHFSMAQACRVRAASAVACCSTCQGGWGAGLRLVDSGCCSFRNPLLRKLFQGCIQRGLDIAVVLEEQTQVSTEC